MIKKKILAVSALVSLIPLASISVISCKSKKTETNNQEQQKPSTPNTPGSPSAPDKAPEIEKPSVDQNNPAEKPGGDDSSGGSEGGSGGTGGSDGDNNSDTTLGIMRVNTSSLSYTADGFGKWWMNIWITGSNLSNNIDHYKFYAKDKNSNVVIPNDYFKVQHVDSAGGFGYFTQRQVNGGQHNDLFNWMKEQFDKGNYDAIIVEPVRDNIRPTNVQQKPSIDGTSSIANFWLQKTYQPTGYERAIVVSGQNLPNDWSKYELKWKETKDAIPMSFFRNSTYNLGSYQVFILKSTADKKFVDKFDELLSKQVNLAKDFFELTLKSNSSK